MYCYDFKSLFPKYNMTYERDNVTIRELDQKAKVKSITWQNSCFQNFDTHIAKDMTSFFQAAKASNLFYDDCDGLIMFNEEGQKYMFFNELKSNFDSRDIYHARNQIISTYLKFNLLFHFLQGYDPSQFIVKGFIVSLPPNKDYLRDLHKQTFVPNGLSRAEAVFTYNLCYNEKQKCEIKPSDCFEITHLPLADRGIFKKMEIYHIDVNPLSSSITLDVKDFI